MKSIIVLFTLLSVIGCASTTDYSRRDDSRNEALATKNIRASHPELRNAHFNVNSFDGHVLITGQVNSAEQASLAGEAVSRMRNVRRVHNELVVAGPTSLLSRTNDSWLTSKVKSQLLTADDLEGGRIKVVTENGVVYLMGKITRQEGDLAVDLTRQVYGIQKIVKVFQYLN